MSASRPVLGAQEILDRMMERGSTSLRTRLTRLRTKWWQILQCAIAAGVAWYLAKHLLHHSTPVFAPLAAVASLGVQWGRRVRRVGEVALGVSLGVLIGDLLVAGLGQGWWQLMITVALAFTVAILLDAGIIFQAQAASQAIFVTAVLPGNTGIWTRWTEALVGGVVALVAASVVPVAPLVKPRQKAAAVAGKIAALLRSAALVMTEGPGDHGYEILADARDADRLVADLRAAADEGMGALAASPFRRARHEAPIRLVTDIVEPLERALRSTRILVRQVAVASHRGRPVPASYARLTLELAHAVDLVNAELQAGRSPEAAQSALLLVGLHSAEVERTRVINAEAILVQVRSVVVDLLVLTGMGQIEASDALPAVG
jgi:uncharacterized membrane protein YgaE (UPF0421/DUF939 family)